MRITSSRQIDPGLYTVFNRQSGGDEVEVGKVYVTGSGDVLIEHYVLSQEHQSPGTLRDMVVGKPEESPGSLAEFFASMRRRLDGQSVTYIKATCEYMDHIPEL